MMYAHIVRHAQETADEFMTSDFGTIDTVLDQIAGNTTHGEEHVPFV